MLPFCGHVVYAVSSSSSTQRGVLGGRASYPDEDVNVLSDFEIG